MNIVIIGPSGFIGSHCVDYFKSKRWNVWKVDVNDSRENNFYKIERQNSDFSLPFIENNFDVCINASGSANVGFSFENPSKDFELNVVNVQKILVAIRDYNPNCKFINFSSAAVYGNPQILPITEENSCKPLSPYGFHKLQSELLLTEYHNFFNLKTCSLRVFSAFGPRLKKQLFWDVYQKSISKDLTFFGTGNETRDFIFIDDLLQIIELIINKSNFKGAIYNAANGEEIKINKAISIFLSEIQSDANSSFSGEIKIGDPINWRADINKILALGYKSKIDFDLGLNKYAKWLKENE